MRETQCANDGNSLSHFFDKNFVKATFSVKKILKMISRNLFIEGESIVFQHCVVYYGKYSAVESEFS